MTIENNTDIEHLRAIGKIVARCLHYMGSSIKPGMTTAQLDELGKVFLLDHGARSAPQLVYNFPGATCISVNEEAAHGIPGSRVIKEGDLVNIDVSAEMNGFFSDTGGSFIVPPGDDLKEKLCRVTRQALQNAMNVAKAGSLINLIGKAIEQEANRNGFTVIENIGSHGVGKALHEEPEFIAGFYDPKDKRVLKENQVITIEPFISTGARVVRETGDGWTLATPKKFLTAQYEHTMVITKGMPIVLTQS